MSSKIQSVFDLVFLLLAHEKCTREVCALLSAPGLQGIVSGSLYIFSFAGSVIQRTMKPTGTRFEMEKFDGTEHLGL